MSNTAEYKNYLFVTVPEDATDFMLLTKAGERDFWRLPDDVMNRIDLYANGVYNTPVVWLNLFGSWQIIGKGDAIDWEGIVERIAGQNKYSGYPIGNWYMDYERKKPELFKTATESGNSLLRSLGMEPGTCLVLKKKS